LATLFSIADADPAYGEIYLKGQWGRIDNLVYPDGFIMTENYPTEFEEVIYGLDFGNVHPTALIAAGKKDGEYYLWEVIYEPLKKKMKTNFGLIERMQEAQIDYGAHIYADIQGGQYIDEIKEKGFYNIKGAAKGKGSVSSGIDVVKRCKIHTKPENININKELLSYKHKENSEGKPIEGEYVNLYNDALDAIRYMITEDTMKEVDLNIWFGTAKV
jgi:phage terminase large subunit